MNNDIKALLDKYYVTENAGWTSKNCSDHSFSVHFIKHLENVYCVVFDTSNSYKHFCICDDEWLEMLKLIDFFNA